MSKCDLCYGEDGCRPMNSHVAQLPGLTPLSKEDWAEIYWFMRYVYLPFMHRIVARARRRGREQ